MKGKSCLTNLISFYDKVTHLMDEGKAVDVVYLDFSKAFDTVSYHILLEKLAAYGLDGCTVHWVTHLMDEGKAVDVVYLDFSKAFDTVSYHILLEKLAAYGLDGCTVHWVKNWLDGQAQRVVGNRVKSH
ncbi:hypothetical protein HGM15179_018057 [Zosterops borbonicus]|uniref:Reverse transcriptase domain-containing protein n=1 Tax=Zosterops borbonicus TaxID=364589 RepID=A0A8K1LCM4_9PASS|nr:hypothetical protein HGM15179_018057 [Zosterops borbonicus]